MKKTRSLFPLLALTAAVVCPLLAGCSQGTTSTMSKEDEKNFKGGGPMPPEAIKAMQGGGPKPAPGGPPAAGQSAPGGPPAAAGKP